MKRTLFILIILLCVHPLVARNQKSQLSSSLSLGFTSSSGNTQVQSANAAIQSALTDSIKEFSFNLRYIFGQGERVMNQREFLSGLQYDYLPLGTFSPFARSEVYSNTFKQITIRYSGLVGAKYRIYRKEKNEYSISMAFQADFEKYTEDAKKEHLEMYRLSIRPKFSQIIMKNIILLQEVFYRPVIKDFSDYQLLSITSLAFTVNKLISLKCSYLYDFDSSPVSSTVKKTDTAFTSALVISF